jgi:hypothetical protein
MYHSLVIKELQEYEYEEEQRIVAATGVHTPSSCFQVPDPAIVVKKQKKYKDEEKERAVVSSADVFTI